MDRLYRYTGPGRYRVLTVGHSSVTLQRDRPMRLRRDQLEAAARKGIVLVPHDEPEAASVEDPEWCADEVTQDEGQTHDSDDAE